MEHTFTFLFTDIEGSTRLWEHQPQVMSALLAVHNNILEQAVESHNGRVFKTVGDGFCAVFDLAQDALAAALCAQRKLSDPKNQKTTPSITLKVRMGLHSGPAEERDGDYFGPTLNRTARLMAAASGEQILLSSAAKACLENTLPQEIELRDLGNHRLRDLKEAEHIFQAVALDLKSNFPPIKSLSPRATNMPAQLTSFVGRQREEDDICRMMRLPHVRLLTLLGSGGIGKTRLSIQVGSNLLDEYEDGAFFIALAPVIRPEMVIEAIAQTLKIEETGETTLLEAVKTYLRERHLLLILDNFEQVIDAAPLVNELLAVAQHLNVLTTSREELMIYGEHIYAVPPLTLPETVPMTNLQTLMQFSAIELFVDRVQSIQPDFTVNTLDAPHVVKICQRLDGLPLAIELAAVRIREFSVETIAEQLSSRLQVLSKGPRDFPSRQRTMRGAIEWSYDMLPAEEQQAFARLGVFVGTFTAEAADAVTGAQTLNRLKEKSLIHQVQESETVVTFFMLETLREYALEQLHIRSELETLQRLHAGYYLQLTKIAEPNLTGINQIEWFNRLEVEKNNVQAALEWLISQADTEGAGCMAGVLWRFWSAHSRLSTGSYWMEQILADPGTMSTHIRAKVTHGTARLLFLQYRYPQATEYLKSSLTLYEQSGDQRGQAAIYLSLGEIELIQANCLAAEGYFQNGLTLSLSLEDQAGVANCLGQLGRLSLEEGNLSGAESLFQQSLELLRQHGSTESTAIVLNDLAEVLRAQKRYGEAAALYRESLALYQQLNFDNGVAAVLHNLGQIARQQGDNQEALCCFQRALYLLQEMEEKQIIAECLAGMGGVFLQHGEVERAIRCFSASSRLMDVTQLQLDLADQAEYECNLNSLREQLDEVTWVALWEESQSLHLDQILAEALHA